MTPRPAVPGESRVIPVAVAPVRDEPAHQAERVTEWVLGETIRVEAVEGGWLRGTGPDGYAGWTPAAPLDRSVVDARDWAAAARLRSMGTALVDGGLGRLPWGARICPGGYAGAVELPDGTVAVAASPERIVDAPDPGRPATAGALVMLAREWVGVPYGWGGRTELGVDCSGLVQGLFGILGVGLPRDSRQQREVGADLSLPVSGGIGPEAGDLLFFAPEGGTITHVALALGGWRILHAASSNGQVQEDDLSADGPLGRVLADSIVARTRPLDA